MAGRFLSRARGDPHKAMLGEFSLGSPGQAIKLMLATQEWKADYFKAGPVADTQVMEDLKSEPFLSLLKAEPREVWGGVLLRAGLWPQARPKA